MYIQTNVELTLDDLSCTEKAKSDIQNFTNDLTGRERQLLILMSSNIELCAKTCSRLLAKVDLNALVERGYLSVNSEMLDEAFTHNSTNMPVAKNNDEPEAFLRLMAGDF